MRMNEASDGATNIKQDNVAKAVGVFLLLILHRDVSVPMPLPLVFLSDGQFFLKKQMGEWRRGQFVRPRFTEDGKALTARFPSK